MTITALPAAPARSDPPETFISKADAFLAALPTFVTEANITALAMNNNATNDTSSTSNTIAGSGDFTFTVSAGKGFLGGMYLVIADTAAPATNGMFVQVKSYSGSTLVVTSKSAFGSGTKTGWTISQSSYLSSIGQVLAQSGANADITSLSACSSITGLASLNGGQLAGFRNRIINGAFWVNQRNSPSGAQTITAGAALAYWTDRWYCYCTGANATFRTLNLSSSQARNVAEFTGAASVTGIGFGTRLEAVDTYDMNGQTATLSVELSNTLLTSVSWAAYYANTADTFGTLASPTRTLISSGTFTVNSTLTKYSTPISIPAAAITGIEIVLSVGAQTSGTWRIHNAQLEIGTAATPFEVRPLQKELSLCQRYYEKSFAFNTNPANNVGAGSGEFDFMAGKAAATAEFGYVSFKVTKRVSPTTITLYNPAAANSQVRDITASVDCSAAATTNVTDGGFRVTATGNASTAVGNILGIHWTAEAEL